MAVTMTDQPCDQIIAPCALDRGLARGIDLGDANNIGIVEAGAKFLEMVVQTAVAVGLVDRDNATFGGLTCGFQHGGNLDRVRLEPHAA